MKLSLAATLGLALSVTGLPASSTDHEAPVVTHNPRKLFHAELQDKSNTTVRGFVNIWSQPVGVKVQANFRGLPQNLPLRMSPPSSWARVYHIIVSITLTGD